MARVHLPLLLAWAACADAYGVAPRLHGPLLRATAPPARHRRAPPPAAISNLEPNLDMLSKNMRRQIYDILAPIDKGDFRWEFLVPFNNKTLTRTDKFIVCSAFIGSSFTIQTLCDPGASVGVHLSYIAQFFSYAMGDPIGFRLLAVLTSLLEIAGDLLEEKGNGIIAAGFDPKDWVNVDAEDVFPVLYNQLFIFINSYYILRCGPHHHRRRRV